MIKLIIIAISGMINIPSLKTKVSFGEKSKGPVLSCKSTRTTVSPTIPEAIAAPNFVMKG